MNRTSIPRRSISHGSISRSLAVFLSLLLLTVSVPAAADTAIVGGGAADQPYPFATSLTGTDGKYFCGAALITPVWLVTAAHCVRGRQPAEFTARVASADRTKGGELAHPTQVVVHPDFDPNGPGGDLALVRLSAPVRAAPVPLASAAPVGTKARVLGWGQTCPTAGCGGEPAGLQQLDTTLVAASRCTRDFDAKVELCTDNPGGKAGVCYGDSGGPEVTMVDQAWRLLGVTSRPGDGGETCATAPAIHTSAVAYANWIRDRTKG